MACRCVMCRLHAHCRLHCVTTRHQLFSQSRVTIVCVCVCVCVRVCACVTRPFKTQRIVVSAFNMTNAAKQRELSEVVDAAYSALHAAVVAAARRREHPEATQAAVPLLEDSPRASPSAGSRQSGGTAAGTRSPTGGVPKPVSSNARPRHVSIEGIEFTQSVTTYAAPTPPPAAATVATPAPQPQWAGGVPSTADAGTLSGTAAGGGRSRGATAGTMESVAAAFVTPQSARQRSASGTPGEAGFVTTGGTSLSSGASHVGASRRQTMPASGGTATPLDTVRELRDGVSPALFATVSTPVVTASAATVAPSKQRQRSLVGAVSAASPATSEVATPGSTGAVVVSIAPACASCKENGATVTLIPCRHTCLCGVCFHAISASLRNCPVCRHFVADTEIL
jgi:hypothetical protein